jgi:hypothetical protein
MERPLWMSSDDRLSDRSGRSAAISPGQRTTASGVDYFGALRPGAGRKGPLRCHSETGSARPCVGTACRVEVPSAANGAEEAAQELILWRWPRHPAHGQSKLIDKVNRSESGS